MHPDFIEISDKFSNSETTDREMMLWENDEEVSDE